MMFNIKKLIPVSIKDKIKSEMELFKLKGNKYYCPICGFRAKEMFTIGADFPVLYEKQITGCGRRVAGCYKCNSTDKERLVYLFVKDRLKIFEGPLDLKILHMAPEINLSRKLLEANFSEYLCGDLFLEGYKYPSYVSNMNLLDLPFESNYFDLVLCSHVLEHISDDKKAMGEIFRVLKSEGNAILQVPISRNTHDTFEDKSVTDPQQREILFGQFDHVRIYGQDYKIRLESIGFQVQQINISQEYGKFGLNEYEDVYLVTKK